MKITLAEARESGAVGLLAYCTCHNVGRMDLAAAVQRYSEERRLDEVPFVCSKCGSRDIDVRPEFPNPHAR